MKGPFSGSSHKTCQSGGSGLVCRTTKATHTGRFGGSGQTTWPAVLGGGPRRALRGEVLAKQREGPRCEQERGLGIGGPGQAADRSRACSLRDSDSRVNWPPRQRHGHLSPSTHRPPRESIPRTLGSRRESTQSPLCSLRKVCKTGLNNHGFASRDFCAGHL